MFIILINFFLHPLYFENVTHHHEKTNSFVDDGQLSEYFNVFYPVDHRDNEKKMVITRMCTMYHKLILIFRKCSFNKFCTNLVVGNQHHFVI